MISLLQVAAQLFKRVLSVLLGITILTHHKYLNFRQRYFQYAFFSIACIVYYFLHLQWVFRTIILSGDVETNPGPETLTFFCWNLKSIAVHNFLCVSLIAAYT